MANKTLFKSPIGKLLPVTDAQYAATGCLNKTFYASADEQLAKVLELCEKVEPELKLE